MEGILQRNARFSTPINPGQLVGAHGLQTPKKYR